MPTLISVGFGETALEEKVPLVCVWAGLVPQLDVSLDPSSAVRPGAGHGPSVWEGSSGLCICEWGLHRSQGERQGDGWAG